ncbi:MAG: hypothetical protein AAFO79_01130, partial [Pseudomonadota bacterium]
MAGFNQPTLFTGQPSTPRTAPPVAPDAGTRSDGAPSGGPSADPQAPGASTSQQHSDAQQPAQGAFLGVTCSARGRRWYERLGPH